MKILIVDDNKTSRSILSSLLTSRSFEILEASDGEQALTVTRTSSPDIIISDILMPVMDGFTLCRKLKLDSALKQIPFIFYTATFTEPKDIEFALSLGACRFLTKPLLVDEIIHVVTECLNTSKSSNNSTSNRSQSDNDEYYKGYSNRLANKLENKASQLVQANQTLEEKDENIELLLQSTAKANYGIYVVDLKGDYIFSNNACPRLLGYTDSSELIGKNIHSLIHHAHPYGNPYHEEHSQIYQAFREQREVHCDDEIFLRKDGTFFHAEYWSYPIQRNGQCIGAAVTFVDITQRKQAESRLKQSQERQRNLIRRLQIVREEERNKIAKNIHDDLGQALTAIRLDIAWLHDRLAKNDDLINPINTVMNDLDVAIDRIRRITSGLRPSVLDDFGLCAAVEYLINDFKKHSVIEFKIDFSDECNLEGTIKTEVFRIIQEALTNAVRHSAAAEIEIKYVKTKAIMEFTIKDNGKGINPSFLESNQSIGLISMHERASAVGGSLSICRCDDKGTIVRLCISIGTSKSKQMQ